MNTNSRVLALIALVCASASSASAQCAGFCGTNTDTCYCDDLCTFFQDCCADVCDVCSICGDDQNPVSSSCAGNCGQNAGLCWCDNLCSNYGDCCDDACDLCAPADGGPSDCLPPSCTVDDCQSDSPIAGCFCDDLCTSFNDCCTGDDAFNSGAGSACEVCGFCYADEILSCDGFCDQNTGSCWCDAACTSFGDCCEDVNQFCGIVVPDGCSGFCGSMSYNCYCDGLCTFYDDCCDDYTEECPCVGNCGSSAGTCSCADTCTTTGNCCDDYEEVCTVAGTCVNFCGGQNAAAGCFCDALCTVYQDCCGDAVDECLTCSDGICGFNTGACWCDELCSQYQDCCPNTCDFCSLGCFVDLECDSDESLLRITINPDLFADEISYQILDSTITDSNILVSKGGYTGEPVQECLSIGNTYTISILDSFSDGFLPGNYEIVLGGSSINGNGDIADGITYQVTVPSTGSASFQVVDNPCILLQDCNQNCMGFQFASWAGDGICDQGGFGEIVQDDGTTLGVNLNCDAYPAEAADCSGPSPDLVAIGQALTPTVSFPFNEGTGTTLTAVENSEIVAELIGASWVTDNLKQTPVLQCVQEETDLILIDDFKYSASFTFFLAFRHEDSPGDAFEYLYSHGDASSSIFSENNFNIYFPEATHPANGIIRTSIYDKSDSGQEQIYLDSDGQVSYNGPRNIPGHINVVDDSWHMMAVRKIQQQGYSVFIDGRKYAELDGTQDIPGPPVIPTQGYATQNMNPKGQAHLCGRSDKDNNRHYSGFITDFYVFDSPLNDTEILAFTTLKGYTNSDCPLGQVKDLCGVCGGSNGNIAPESKSLCCEPISMLGDVNKDGIFTVLDIIPLANFLLEEGSLTACQEVYADVNSDDNLSVTDIIIIANLITA